MRYRRTVEKHVIRAEQAHGPIRGDRIPILACWHRNRPLGITIPSRARVAPANERVERTPPATQSSTHTMQMNPARLPHSSPLLIVKGILFALLGLTLGTPDSRAQVIYTLGSDDALGPAAFGRIDVSSGTYTQIRAPQNDIGNLINLTWNSSIGKFYTIAQAPAVSVFFGDIRTVDTSGNVSSSIATIYSDAYGMALRPADGRLYTVDAKSVSYWAIDLSAGPSETLLTPSTAVGFGPGGPAGGRIAVHQDTLYVAIHDSSLGLGRFGSLGYSAGSVFNQIGATDPTFKDMVLTSDGTHLFGLVGVNSSTASLFVLDPATGALGDAIPINGSGMPRYFTGAAAIPEPMACTAVLAAVLLAGVLAKNHRRR